VVRRPDWPVPAGAVLEPPFLLPDKTGGGQMTPPPDALWLRP